MRWKGQTTWGTDIITRPTNAIATVGQIEKEKDRYSQLFLAGMICHASTANNNLPIHENGIEHED